MSESPVHQSKVTSLFFGGCCLWFRVVGIYVSFSSAVGFCFLLCSFHCSGKFPFLRRVRNHNSLVLELFCNMANNIQTIGLLGLYYSFIPHFNLDAFIVKYSCQTALAELL